MKNINDKLSEIQERTALIVQAMPGLVEATNINAGLNIDLFEKQVSQTTYVIGSVAAELLTVDALLKSFKNELEIAIQSTALPAKDETLWSVVVEGVMAECAYNHLYSEMQEAVLVFRKQVDTKLSKLETAVSNIDTVNPLRVTDDISVGRFTRLTFDDGSSLMAEEIRSEDKPPYWVVPQGTTGAQITAIQEWSKLTAKEYSCPH